MDVGHGQLNPWLGVAYRLTEKTVVRSGYGISTDPSNFSYMILIYPNIISQQIAGTNSYSAAGSLATRLPAFNGPDLTLEKFPLPTAFPKVFAAARSHRTTSMLLVSEAV